MTSRTSDLPLAQASRSGLACVLLALLTAFAVSPAMADAPNPAETETWSVSDLRTSFAFRHDLLDGIGLSIEDLEATGAALDHHVTSVSEGRDVVFAGMISPSLDLRVVGHVPQRFDGTVLHQGGFRITGDSLSISMAPFSVRSGAEPRTLEVLSRDGEVVFYADKMHFSLERELGRLRSFNLDLRLSEAMAARLKAPSLAGVFVGSLAMEANFAPREADPLRGGECVPDWSGDVDVQLTAIDDVDQVVETAGLIGIAPSAELKNVGTADVPWWRKFSGPNPPYNNDQHPFLVWGVYRMTDARIEQLGVSDIKHAFLTLNFNCTPQSEGCDNQVLGLGCEDIYGTGTNDSRSHLSYRDEIESAPALWNSMGSHFDPDDDGTQEHPPQNPDGTLDHRLLVPESELGDGSSTYFMHAFYIIRDDINIFNSMAYREMNPTDNGSFWSFPLSGSTLNGSVLDNWVDPVNPPAGTSNSTVADGGGFLQLAGKATTLQNGQVRFEYALMNHNYDAQLDAFMVPLSGEAAFDIDFQDSDDDPSNDWQTSVVDGRLVWRLPAGAQPPDSHTGGAGLDWGLMYNFAFTVFGGGSQNAQALMEPLATLGAIRVDTVAPSGGSGLIFFDGFESQDTSAWSTSVP